MWCFKKYIIPIKWMVIGYILILSIFIPGFVLMISNIDNDIEFLVTLMMHLFIIPFVIIKVMQMMYVKLWVTKIGGFKHVVQIGDTLISICIWICVFIQLAGTITYAINQKNIFLYLLLLNYLLFLNINIPKAYISKEYLIINNLLIRTDSISKIKSNRFRLYIKTKDDSVYRIWCRGQKAAILIEQNIQVLIYENIKNYQQV